MGEVQKNVYELAQERLHIIFKEFDNICVSFSGGKDSGVLLNLCIDYIRRNNLKRKLSVYHMDYEIQYSMTIDYVDRILEANKPYIIAMPNNSNYDSKYNITGDITFEAQNITVKATPNELKSVPRPSIPIPYA